MARQAGIDKRGNVLGVYESWAVEAAKAGRLSGPLRSSLLECASFRALSSEEAKEIGEASLARIARAHRGMAEGVYQTSEKLEDGGRKALARAKRKRPNPLLKGGANA